MAIQTPLAKLSELLRERCRAWSEMAEAQPHPGLRAITIYGDVLRAVVVQGAQQKLFDAIALQLPKDFTVMDLDGEMIRMLPSYSGNPRDAYCMIVASAEWPPCEEGVEVPDFPITLTRNWWGVASR